MTIGALLDSLTGEKPRKPRTKAPKDVPEDILEKIKRGRDAMRKDSSRALT